MQCFRCVNLLHNKREPNFTSHRNRNATTAQMRRAYESVAFIFYAFFFTSDRLWLHLFQLNAAFECIYICLSHYFLVMDECRCRSVCFNMCESIGGFLFDCSIPVAAVQRILYERAPSRKTTIAAACAFLMCGKICHADGGQMRNCCLCIEKDERGNWKSLSSGAELPSEFSSYCPFVGQRTSNFSAINLTPSKLRKGVRLNHNFSSLKAISFRKESAYWCSLPTSQSQDWKESIRWVPTAHNRATLKSYEQNYWKKKKKRAIAFVQRGFLAR